MLGEKFCRTPDELAEADRLIRGFADVVQSKRRLAAATEGPDDDRIRERTVAAGARALVSGDEHLLLRLGEFEGISVVTAAAFLERHSPAPPGQVHGT